MAVQGHGVDRGGDTGILKAISGAISAAKTSAADELTDLVNSGPADAETVLEAEDVVETEAAVVQAEAALGEGEAIVQTAGAVGE